MSHATPTNHTPFLPSAYLPLFFTLTLQPVTDSPITLFYSLPQSAACTPPISIPFLTSDLKCLTPEVKQYGLGYQSILICIFEQYEYFIVFEWVLFHCWLPELWSQNCGVCDFQMESESEWKVSLEMESESEVNLVTSDSLKESKVLKYA